MKHEYCVEFYQYFFYVSFFFHIVCCVVYIFFYIIEILQTFSCDFIKEDSTQKLFRTSVCIFVNFYNISIYKYCNRNNAQRRDSHQNHVHILNVFQSYSSCRIVRTPSQGNTLTFYTRHLHRRNTND